MGYWVKKKIITAWVAQSVKHPTSAQVISRFVSLSPESGSVLTAQSLEPASDSVSPSLPLSHSCSVSLLQKINKQLKKIFLNVRSSSKRNIAFQLSLLIPQG